LHGTNWKKPPVKKCISQRTYIAIRAAGKKAAAFPDQTITVDQNNLVLLKRGIYIMSEYIPEDWYLKH